MNINKYICTIILGLCVVSAASAYEIKEDSMYCMITKCQGTSDCNAASLALKTCNDKIAARKKGEIEAERQKNLQQHQAELDMAKKIEEANKAVNPH